MSEKSTCYHCGEDCVEQELHFDNKKFCCSGCKLVYEVLSENDMCNYYDIENTPGVTPPKELKTKFNYLDNDQVVEKLINFKDDATTMASFFLPKIHCSSCIWLLENLYRLNTSVTSSRVNFLKKELHLSFNHNEITYRQLVELLASLGYEPEINLDKAEGKRKRVERSLVYKIGVTGFCFGNIMLISLPEYFGLDTIKEKEFFQFFGYLNILLALPIVFYAASDYFKSAFIGLKQKSINIDVPIVLGVVVLFLRSTYEILTANGAGYMDSLSGLIFFLLLGKMFQQITYNTLSFERDYKSYFPIAITKIENDTESPVSLSEVNVGDVLLIKNNEIIPVDAELTEGRAGIDNSFVTGESKIARKEVGDKIYAGGKQVGGAIQIKVLKKLSQSYLTQLWNNAAFQDDGLNQFENLTNKISKYFTVIILLIATISAVFWFQKDFKIALNAFTAVLIIACPCALALAAPFTYGNVLRILGKNKFFLKNASVIEKITKSNNIVFDKTGTITQSSESNVRYVGEQLSKDQLSAFYSVFRQSSHPLSTIIFNTIGNNDLVDVSNFKELTGLGIEGEVNNIIYKAGSSKFIIGDDNNKQDVTQVLLSVNGSCVGRYIVENKYRKGLKELILALRSNLKLSLITGDNESEKENLKHYFNENDAVMFNQSPEDKLKFIEELQKNDNSVIMIGDGLNDAGALKQSDVGISVSEDVNTFSPACDAILDAKSFVQLPQFVRFCKQSIIVVIVSFIISFLYNAVGLYFSVTGQLSPVVAAILMPLSSITVVVFVTVSTNLVSIFNKLK